MKAFHIVLPCVSLIFLAVPVCAAAAEAPESRAAAASHAAPAEVNAANEVAVPSHEGWYFNARIGLGLWNAKAPDAEFSANGSGIHMGLSLGHTIWDNLVAYGDVFVVTADAPEVESMGQTRQLDDATGANAGVGAGLNYYLMPANVFVGGAVLASVSSIRHEEARLLGTTKPGLGFTVKAGWEPWVWGASHVGFVSELHLASMEDSEGPHHMDTTTFSVGFSGTVD